MIGPTHKKLLKISSKENEDRRRGKKEKEWRTIDFSE